MKNKNLVVILVAAVVLLCCCTGGALTGMAYYYYNVAEKITPTPTVIQDDDLECVVSGCSGQLCISIDDMDRGMTTCEWRDEYACFKDARCEKQANGKCDWTYTDAYYNCMEDIE